MVQGQAAGHIWPVGHGFAGFWKGTLCRCNKQRDHFRSHVLNMAVAMAARGAAGFTLRPHLLSWTVFLGGGSLGVSPRHTGQLRPQCQSPHLHPQGLCRQIQADTPSSAAAAPGGLLCDSACSPLLLGLVPLSLLARSAPGRMLSQHGSTSHPRSPGLASRSHQPLPALDHFPFHAFPALCSL